MLLGAVIMGSGTLGKHNEYNTGKVKVYISATLATLSIVLALLALTEVFLLMLYFVFTFLLTTVILALKIRFLSERKLQSQKNIP